MGLHYGVLRARPDRAKQKDGVRPTTSQNRKAVSSWQVARDTDGQETRWRLALNKYDPPTVILNTARRAQRGETCRKRRSTQRISRHGSPVRGDE